MFSTELGYRLEAAYKEASNRKHAFFCVEHLLYSLLFDPEIVDILRHCGADIELLKKDLESYFDEHVETQDMVEVPDEFQLGKDIEPIQTPAVKRVLERAIIHSQSSGKDLITSKEVLVQVFNELDSHAVFALNEQNVSKLDVLNYISHGISKIDEFDEEDSEEEVTDYDPDRDKKKRRKKSALEQFAEELTAQAKEELLDPIIGREAEIERTLKILSRRQKNNPLYLGDPGVGKSAMASAIAQRIVSGNVPDNLRGARLYSLQMGSLVAGTKFRGEFEERIRRVLKEISKKENAIVFIDEIHQLVGAGATGSGSMDAANLLKPALQSGKLRCIGSTTHDDFKKNFDKDRALSRRFSVIDLDEPSIEETVKILEGLKDKFEEHHNVRYQGSALRAAAELSAKHINDRFLPDKAIDVIDEAGAANNLLPISKRRKSISKREIEKVVASMAKVPVGNVDSDDEKKLKSLEANLKRQVYGRTRQFLLS